MKLENLKNNYDIKALPENKDIQNTEFKEQLITLKDSNTAKIIQLREAITNFGNKYIVKLPFKEILGIRIPV